MIKAKVKGQDLTIDQPVVAAGTIAYLEIQFDFSEDWNGLEKTAHFLNNDDDIVYDVLIENDKIAGVKQLNLSAGTWFVWIHGNEYKSGKMATRITTDIAKIKVKSTGMLDGEPLKITPPSIGEQILGIATEAKSTAEAAKEAAETLSGFSKDLFYEKNKFKGTSIIIPQYTSNIASVLRLESESETKNNKLLPTGFTINSNDTTYTIPEGLISLHNYGYGAGEGYNNTIDFENGKYTQRCEVIEPTEGGSVGDRVYFIGFDAEFPMSRYDEWVKAIETVKCSHSELTFEYSEVTQYEDGTISSGMLKVMLNGIDPSVEELQAFIDDQRAAGTPVTICYGLPDPIETDITDMASKIDITITPGGVVTFDGAIGTLELFVPKEFASKKYVNNTAANALRGTLFGANVSADDVSPLEHELDIKVKSKNIIPTPYYDGVSLTRYGITYTINEDYSITVKSNGAVERGSYFGIVGNSGTNEYLAPILEDGTTYTLSAEVVENNGEILPNVARTGNIPAGGVNAKILGTTGKTSAKFSVNKSDSKYYGILIDVDKNMIGKAIDCTIKVQLEKGGVATPITPPSMDVEGVNVILTDGENSQTATADADGNVTGLTSMSPNMTLTTDNEGAVIECGYNKDTNKVIENLTNAIISLGGNI